MYESHKGKVMIMNSRRGIIRRVNVLGLIKCQCMEIKWEDTKKSEMIKCSTLQMHNATFEDGTPVCDGCDDNDM